MLTHVKEYCQRIVSRLKPTSSLPSPLSLRQELASLIGQAVFVESQVVYKNIAFLNQMIQSSDDFHIPLLVTSFPRALNFWDTIEKYRKPCIVRTIRSIDLDSLDVDAIVRGDLTLILAHEEQGDLVLARRVLSDLSDLLVKSYLAGHAVANRFVFDDVASAFEGVDLTKWRVLAANGASFYHLNTVVKAPVGNKEAWGDSIILHGDIESVGSVRPASKLCAGMHGEKAALRPFSQDDLSAMSLSGRFMQRKQNTFYVYSLD